jgi:replicative DNA helicase
VQEAWTIVSPLTTRLNAGLYDEKSLFTKVMSCTLDAGQIDEYKRLVAEQLERRHHAMVLTTVSTIEESLPLVEDQRAKLIELLDAQKVKVIQQQQGMESYVGYAKLAKVQVADLEKLFDKEQMKAIKAVRDRYAPVVQMFNQ